MTPHQIDQFLVRRPIIHLRTVSLHNPPPNVQHHALDAGALESHEASIQGPPSVQGIVHVHAIQRQHHEHWNSATRSPAGRGFQKRILLPQRRRLL